MSASLAMPMAGLPNHNPAAQEMSDYTANEFGHMAPDLSNNSMVNNDHDHQGQPDDQRTDSYVNCSEEDRNQALGNLLTQLTKTPSESIEQANWIEQNPVDPEHSTTNGAEHIGFPIQDNLPPLADWNATPIDTDASFAEHADNNLGVSQLGNTSAVTLEEPATESNHNIEATASTPTRTRIEYEAFGKLVFLDGNFYLNTYAIELGRDVHAFRAAIAREQEEEESKAADQGKAKAKSSENRSHRSARQLGSQIQGSIVSEAGGFAGVDDKDQDEDAPAVQGSMQHSSQASDTSAIVKPHEVLKDPERIPQFDYHKRVAEYAMEQGQVPADDEMPAAVTEDHLPNPYMVPLIPIHGTMLSAKQDVAGHRAISRRHVRIAWNFQKDQWEMTVLGRNGAFLNEEFKKQGWTVKIDHGSKIQISHVEMTFCLPTSLDEQAGDESDVQMGEQAASNADEAIPSIEQRTSATPNPESGIHGSPERKSSAKVNLKSPAETLVRDKQGNIVLGPDRKPIYRKRGPGRPPKNGIMSNRELKERQKAQKAEEAKIANGGKTPPPPIVRGKPTKPSSSTEPQQEDKSEKRKYKKRKRFDENGQLVLGAEGDESDIAEDEERKAKKARPTREKSESPQYPAKETLTPEQLQRPNDPYATLLYKLLMEVYPNALALKQIYRLMKQKWPYFVHDVSTDGWQSSVRHNLNSEFGKLFAKGDKEGKGYAWKAIPDAALPQQDRKKVTAQQGPPKPKPPPQQQRPPYPPGPGQIAFHNTTAFPAQSNPQGHPNGGQWQAHQTQNANWAGSAVQGSQPPVILDGQLGQQADHQNQSRLSMQQNGIPSSQLPGSALPPNALPSSKLLNPTTTPVQAPPVSSSSAPSNMPCTWAGIEAIKRFERELLNNVTGKGTRPREFWTAAFKSASRRCLHGAQGTLLEEDTKEEQTLMTHIDYFIERYANPNFKGFGNLANRTLNGSGPSTNLGPVNSDTNGTSIDGQANEETTAAISNDDNGSNMHTLAANEPPSQSKGNQTISEDD